MFSYFDKKKIYIYIVCVLPKLMFPYLLVISNSQLHSLWHSSSDLREPRKHRCNASKEVKT